MIALVKIFSSEFDAAKKRILKFLRFGKKDTQTAIESSPYGIDSNPVKDMVAVYTTTSEKGKPIILGYLNVDKLAVIGETRLYSTDSTGSLQAHVWLRNTGVVELNGDVHNSVRYLPLDSGLQQQVVAINAELVKIATGIASAGGAYTPQPISLNISASENDQVKMN